MAKNIFENELESANQVSIYVLTGGPVAGKSSLELPLLETLLCRNYDVVWIKESATEIITSGVKPFNGITTPLNFQKILFKMQYFKEELYRTMERVSDRKLIIICDRGLCDAKAYMTDEEWKTILKEEGITDLEILARYRAIIHMVTAANGAEEAFEKKRAENPARSKDETRDVAIALDEKIKEAYLGHGEIYYVGNETDFEGKKQKALRVFLSCLGEPVPSQHQEKIVVKKPSEEYLLQKKAQKRSIVQIYLKSNGKEERRIRMMGDGNSFVYYLTRKGVGNYSDYQEKSISKDVYDALMLEMDTERKPIVKTRWYFSENDTYYNMDVYPNWKNYAVIEIRGSKENVNIELPSGIEEVRNVTDDIRFSNYAFSKYFLSEEEVNKLV
ncbi:MAG: AAA family ATPase [Clostridia bacterium]|nr:AAA family ATPase [Clostridia bacterium]